MRDGEHLATGLLLVASHPLPKVTWVVAAQGFLGGVGLDQTGLGGVVAKDNVAVEVIPAGVRGPLVTDERRFVQFMARLL